jgi:hypothetical protein
MSSRPQANQPLPAECLFHKRQKSIALVFDKYLPHCVIHLAAESHVDRSIEGLASPFGPTSSAPSVRPPAEPDAAQVGNPLAWYLNNKPWWQSIQSRGHLATLIGTACSQNIGTRQRGLEIVTDTLRGRRSNWRCERLILQFSCNR